MAKIPQNANRKRTLLIALAAVTAAAIGSKDFLWWLMDVVM